VNGALEGLRVVDLTQVISGPLATRILADQGADVIKVEPPRGDTIRHVGGRDGMSALFATTNRSKRSLVLDLKQPAAVDVVRRLSASADVFVQNFRPGVADRMGIGERALRADHPELIYVSISGYGDTGPYASQRVYDPLVQAMSGLADVQGGHREGQELVRFIVADKVTALTCAQAITAALVARGRTGRGQHLKLSMLDATVAFLWPEGMAYHTMLDGKARRAPPAERHRIFATRDGHLLAAAIEVAQWQAFCRAAERPELAEDERFATVKGLIVHATERLDLMEEILCERTTDDWLARLRAADVPCAPVVTRERLHEEPQIIANQLVVESRHPVAGAMRQPRPAERLDDTPSEIRGPAPRLGEHSEALLREAGFDAEAISALRAAGALGRG
jgi:crotonobetainyl-CoA:carnitine CoA-transferase CaiB-like acyl-CoA transferase